MIGWNEEVIIKLVAPAWEWALFLCIYVLLTYKDYAALVRLAWGGLRKITVDLVRKT